MKLDVQWPGVVAFSVVFLALAVLVWHKDVPGEAMMTLLAWLIPSPMQRRQPGDSQTGGT